MSMVESMISGLADTPAVKEAMGKLEELKVGVVNAMTHFNGMLTKSAESDDSQMRVMARVLEGMERLERKIDKLSVHIMGDPMIVPAADDGLMKMLEESGQEMIIWDDFAPIPVVHESEAVYSHPIT